jgi:hypothetical protein
MIICHHYRKHRHHAKSSGQDVAISSDVISESPAITITPTLDSGVIEEREVEDSSSVSVDRGIVPDSPSVVFIPGAFSIRNENDNFEEPGIESDSSNIDGSFPFSTFSSTVVFRPAPG